MNKNYRNDFRRGNFRGTVRTYHNKNVEYRTIEVDIEEIRGMKNYERGRSRSRDRTYPGNTGRNGRSSSRSRSGSRASTNRDNREYNHFAKDCPTTKVEKETDQIQQIFNLDEEKTSLKHW